MVARSLSACTRDGRLRACTVGGLPSRRKRDRSQASLRTQQSWRPGLKFGVTAPAAKIYARSQLTCLKIRDATIAGGAGFIDARPAFRRAAAKAFIHGPRGWDHPNQLGYTVLGTLLAQKISQKESDACDDSWE